MKSITPVYFEPDGIKFVAIFILWKSNLNKHAMWKLKLQKNPHLRVSGAGFLGNRKTLLYSFLNKYTHMLHRYSSIKNLLLAFFITATAFSAQAQWVSIPDTNFGKWLNTNGFNMCLQGNSSVGWQMDTTCNKVVVSTFIDCTNSGLKSIEGIQYFHNLYTLHCGQNELTSIPKLPAYLDRLDCSINKLVSLPTLPNSLRYLDCSSNLLTSLPTLPNSLEILNCGDNPLTFLPTLPNSLIDLACGFNQLTYLPPLPNSLNGLGCGGNQLTFLPTLPNSLIELYCEGNQLVSLPALPNSLIFFSCNNNLLTNFT